MPTAKEVESDKVSAGYAIRQVLRQRCSNLYAHLFTATDNPADAVSFKRGDGGIWLCVVKRVNTSTGEREVIFGHGVDLAESLVGANKLVAAGKWVTDKPWPR